MEKRCGQKAANGETPIRTIPCQAQVREGVTTMADECKPVGKRLPLTEARNYLIIK